MSSVAVSRHIWLLCLIALAGSSVAWAQEEAESDPPGRVGRLSLIDGEVSFAPAGTDEWAEAVLNRPVTSEDRVWVGVDGRAELQVGSASVHLDRDTQFGFIELDDDVMQMSLVDGAATIRVRRLAERETIKVETPNATVHLRRVGEYHLEVDPESDQTIVKARSGEAEVSGGSATYTVRANERGVFRGLETLTAQTDPIAPRTPFEAWANDRDRREEQAESAKYVSRDVVGYEDLDDHGEWVQEREYGYVWRPSYVAHDWAPYRFGRWAWVSPWGWTWIDNARWGFAPFHYGRWVHVRHRWCWVPGPRHLRPIYAPALVGWVGGPSVSVSVSFGSGIGWYPLGPREIYYPGYRHTPRYIRHVNVSNTIIVNNNYFTNSHGRRHYGDYRYRRQAHAVTAVHRDQFVGGRPIGGHRFRLDESQLRQWRDDARPPAIAPYRESVLAGQPRERRHDNADRANWFTHRGAPRRVDFTAERRAIENNGGRPIGRAQLIENPKERGDFRVSRRDNADAIKREARQHIQRSGQAATIDRSTQRADARDRQAQPNRSDERIESMRADDGAGSRQRSEDVTRRAREQPQQRRQPPATERLHAAPERRETPVRSRDRTMQGVERSSGNAFRAREASPPPAVRQFSAPPPEQRSRSHEAAPRRESAPREEASPRRGGDNSAKAPRSHGSRRPD